MVVVVVSVEVDVVVSTVVAVVSPPPHGFLVELVDVVVGVVVSPGFLVVEVLIVLVGGSVVFP